MRDDAAALARLDTSAYQSTEYAGLDEGYKHKRAFDVTVSVILIVGTLPFMLLAAVMVMLTSRGPVIFRQKREGQDGNYFTLYKFRTLYHEAPEIVGVVSEGCPYVTHAGKLLRAVHWDELPQLFNVLRGDMHVVGPRPNTEASASRRRAKNSRYGLVIRRKPGLTCPVSLAGKWEDLVKAYPAFDPTERELQYFSQEESLLFDLKMVFLTGLKMVGVRFQHPSAKH